MKYELPELKYSFDSLEPYIDSKTMEVHYTKHHQGYCNKFNLAIEGHNLPELEDIFRHLDNIPEEIRNAVKNNGGGYINHNIFWSILGKDVPFEGDIKEEIEKEFGSKKEFNNQFKQSATTLFGSGWTWLVWSDKLEIMNLPNQENPLSYGKYPLIALDVWEHAYYLKYQNRRPEYVDNFLQIINWEEVNQRLQNAKNN